MEVIWTNTVSYLVLFCFTFQHLQMSKRIQHFHSENCLNPEPDLIWKRTWFRIRIQFSVEPRHCSSFYNFDFSYTKTHALQLQEQWTSFQIKSVYVISYWFGLTDVLFTYQLGTFPSCGSGSVCLWTSRIRNLLSSSKNSKENLDSYCFSTSLWLFS